MKSNNHLSIALAGIFFFTTGSPARAGGPSVTVYGNATYDSEVVILDLFADVADTELRSFGISVGFDIETLEPVSMGRPAELWYLSKPDGNHVSYLEPELVDRGLIRLVGGHLDAVDPSKGVSGRRVLLATIIFSRNGGLPGEFEIGLASPPPYANFVSTGGDSLDNRVDGLGAEVPLVEAPADTDNDGLPDPYEMDVFGGLGVSDGESDSDGDGSSDLDEWLGGTDPNDPNSNIRLEWLRLPNGEHFVCWTSVPGRVYTIEQTADLSLYSIFCEGLPGIGGKDALPVVLDGRGFYQLIMSNPTDGR